MSELFFTGATPDEVWPLVKQHHYSKRMPSNIQHCYAVRSAGGIFGDYGEVLAAAVFAYPPTRWSEKVIELIRLVRKPDLSAPLTRLLSFGCQHIRKQGWHLAISFADQQQGHHGGIYQAAGWHYDGRRDRRMDGVLFNGVFKPGRSCNNAFGTQSPEKLRQRFPYALIEPHYDDGKHLYWKPLTVGGKTMAKRLGLARRPYPKPNAARPLDEQAPACASTVQPCGAAPAFLRRVERAA